MPALDPKLRRMAAAIAATTRHNGPDDPRLTELHRDLAAERLAEHVRRVVDEAPPLTAEQRDKIATLLRGPAAPDGGGAAA